MTKRAESVNKSTNVGGAKSAAQICRELLDKKLAAQKTNAQGKKGSAFQANIKNRFQNTDSGNSSRKSRKGYRPG